MPSLADARAASAAGAGWSVLGEYRVSPRPTSLTNRSREPIVAAHPFNALAARRRLRGGPGRAQPPGDPDQPRRRQDVAHRRRPPAGRRQPPDGRLGPGPDAGTARLYYTAMGGPAPNYHFERQLQRQRGPDLAPRLHRQQHARLVGRHGGPGRRHQPGQPQLRRGLPRLQLAQGPDEGRRLPRRRVGRLRPHVRRHRDPEAPAPAGYGDAWRIGYKLATAPDGSAYVAGYQLDMKHWRQSSPVRQGRQLEHRTDRLRCGPAALRPRGAPADPRAERAGDEAAGDRLEPRLDAGAEGRQRRPGGASWATGLVGGSRWAASTTRSRATGGSAS